MENKTSKGEKSFQRHRGLEKTRRFSRRESPECVLPAVLLSVFPLYTDDDVGFFSSSSHGDIYIHTKYTRVYVYTRSLSATQQPSSTSKTTTTSTETRR